MWLATSRTVATWEAICQMSPDVSCLLADWFEERMHQAIARFESCRNVLPAQDSRHLTSPPTHASSKDPCCKLESIMIYKTIAFLSCYGLFV